MGDTFKDCRTRPIFIHSSLDDIPLSMEAFRVYCHLARRANECYQAWPSYRSIGEKCFRGSYPDSQADSLRRKAITAVKELISWNLISVEKRVASDGSAASNLYCLTDDSQWLKSVDTPSPNARKSRAYQPRERGQGVVMGEHYPNDGGTLPPLVMGEHYPSDGGSPGGDGGSPKVYPLEVNPIEVTPHSPLPPQGEKGKSQKLEEEGGEREILLGEEEKKAKAEELEPELQLQPIPERKLIHQTKTVAAVAASINRSEAIKRTPSEKASAPDRPLPPWRCSWETSDYDLRFLDYLITRYLPKVGRWRDLGEKPTSGDAKNWIDARERRGEESQIQNKWDDYQSFASPADRDRTPYTPPVTALTMDIPSTPEGLMAKERARVQVAAIREKLAPQKANPRRRL